MRYRKEVCTNLQSAGSYTESLCVATLTIFCILSLERSSFLRKFVQRNVGAVNAIEPASGKFRFVLLHFRGKY